MDLKKDGVKKKAVRPTDLTMRLTIDGHPDVYQVYEIRLDLLYYNDQNDRIATWISQYRSEHKVETFDRSDIEKYNSIIHQFITESNPDALKKTQTNIELIGQDVPGVVLADGRIIDGNRRFTCLRNIAAKTHKPLYFKAVILDHDIETSAKQIKLLELQLQHGVDKPVDYNPIDRLVGIYNDIIKSKMITVEEYASSVNQDPSEIIRDVELANLMVEYLEFLGAPGQFHLVRTMNLNGPLRELYAMLKKVHDKDMREDLKNVVFTNFLAQPAGDMTRYIRKIKKIAANPKHLKGYLAEQLEKAEAVCDALAEHPITSEKDVNDVRAQSNVAEDLARSTEKFVSRVDGETTRNKPAAQIDKAQNALDGIDTNIFKKLTKDQRITVREKLAELQEMLDKIRSDLDV